MRERFDRAIDAHLSSDRIQQSIDVVLQRELDSRIQEKDFAGVEAGGIVFDTESIAKDRLLVESIKKNFQKHIEHLDHEDVERIVENKKRADALEVVIAEAGELYNWAGENAFFIRSSEYDDLINGVDIIVEFSVADDSGEEPKRIALAIDASMKLDTEGLSVKMGRNISKLMEHTQSSGIQDSEVKYFQSAVSEYRGPLPRIIPVVVGLEGNNANELISLFAAMKTLKKNVSKDQFSRDQLRSINEQLEKHPSQGVFYKEIMLQLGWYQRMLPESKHTNKEALLKEVDSIIAQFASISSQKEKIDLGAYEKDGILAEVRRLTER